MDNRPFNEISIVGSGFMGAQISLICAMHGYNVKLINHTASGLERAAQSNLKILDSFIDAGEINSDEKKVILNHIQSTTSMSEGLAKADLVIEAVPEEEQLKRSLFKQIDMATSDHTIIATNSSSISVSKLEDATKRPDKVLNMHFYPPVWQRKMSELMKGSTTSDETLGAAISFIQSLSLTPLVVRKESTGFIFNRVWRAIKKECLHLVDDGIASADDVDRAWIIAIGMPIGPFGLMDMVGLDVVRDIEEIYYKETNDPSDKPPKLLIEKVERGELGIKTGKGFYQYPDPAYKQPEWLLGDKALK